MTAQVSNRITFTEIFYSVVIATALTRLTFEVSLRNGMLLFALVIIVSDYVEYIASMETIQHRLPRVRTFLIDIVLLLIWNILVIIPEDSFDWYVVFLIVFFACQQAWELVVGEYSLRGVLLTPTTALLVSYAAVAAAIEFDKLSFEVALLVCAVLFAVTKVPAWRRIYNLRNTIEL